MKVSSILRSFLKEDIGSGDITSNATISPRSRVSAQFLVKSEGVIAGLEVAKQVFQLLSRNVQFSILVPDGTPVKKGTVVATIDSPGRTLLSGERVALNLMQRMSGIATATAQYVAAVKGNKTIILDTRKTMPGMRIFDKQAVVIGGGQNHRFGLYDMVMIKDNHIAAVGSITEAVKRARLKDRLNRKLEVEVTNLTELREAIPLSPDRILLDNMGLATMSQAVKITSGKIPLEASGNVNLSTVNEIAKTGVDYISVGALTHSVTAMDISLEVVSAERKSHVERNIS